MTRSTTLFARIVGALVGLSLILTAILVGPAPAAQAAGRETRVFGATFDSAPLGPLAGPLLVNPGTVVADAGTVAVAAVGGSHVLQLDGTAGAATALMRWSNDPGPLPIDSQGTFTVRITGTFSSTVGSTAGASFSLVTGATSFELFQFGANGQLTRNGNPIGLSYAVAQTVSLDARLIVKKAAGSTVLIALTTPSGAKTISVALPAAFTKDTLSQMQFSTLAGGGTATADRLLVSVQKGERRVSTPPKIVINDSDIEQAIERVNGVLFVSISITIVNTGGRSDGTYLILNRADFADFDLDDVGFLVGVGFVKELDDEHVVIGLGQYNTLLSGDRVKVKLKFKAKRSELDIRIQAHFRLSFGSGSYSVSFNPIISTTPISGTNPVSGTTPISGTTPVSGTTVISINRLPISAIDVRFVGAWRSRGGLDIFGLPLTPAIVRPDGIVVQYFERARLEFHPELAGTQYQILIGLLGVELGHSETATAVVPPSEPAELVWYFPQTRHLVGKPFRAFWKGRGGLLLFGLPIGEARMEDGYLVQYFERARFELHPELAGTAYEVQLGHLGVLALQASNGR